MTNSETVVGFPLIDFDRASGVPFYKQVYDGYRDAILSGRLRPGARLPSTRALAAELRVSRLPVVTAFEQLVAEGYVEGKTGAGTYVAATIPDELSAPASVRSARAIAAGGGDGRRLRADASAGAWAADGRGADGRSADEKAAGGRSERAPRSVSIASARDSRSTRESSTSLNLKPFRVSLPALELFPQRIWSRLVARHVRRASIETMAYGDPAGHAPLREAIASYLRAARAVNCEAEQVLVVAGSQMALHLCARVLLAAGDEVCVEEPGYPGARDALASTHARVVPVRTDEGGIDVAALGERREARVVYVTPSHQYPLGVSLAAPRRLELLDWARRRGAWVIEDDYDSEYRYASRPLESLQGLDAGSRVVYVGTFSKVLFPALRVGYMVIPPALFDDFRRAREELDIFSPSLYQVVLNDFLREGHFGRHVRRMRTVYQRRRDALVDALARHAGDLIVPYNTDAGMHLAAFLPDGVDDREVVRQAARRGVSAMALSTCYAGAEKRSGLILGFGGANEGEIDKAARTLALVVRESAAAVQAT